MMQQQAEAAAAVQQRLSEVLPGLGQYVYFFPILAMVIGAFFCLLTGVFRGRPHDPHLPSFGVAVVTAATAAVAPLFIWPKAPLALFGSGILLDDLARLGFVVVALGTFITLLVASLTNIGRQLLRSELVALVLFASAGMMAMLAAGEFLSFFIALEVMSLSLYIMVGYQRESARSLEAVVKYFILGSCASGFILMGAALTYLHVGSLSFADWGRVQLSVSEAPLAVLGAVLLFSGLGFKLAIAPFHSWAPDVYQAAPSSLTGYMATLVKLSVALVILRILGSGYGQGSDVLVAYFWIVGAASIAIGSLFGLVHNSIRRVLAYSSIANAGYFCLAFATLAKDPSSLAAREALVAYSVIYFILTQGAFAVLSWLEEGNREDLMKDDLAGLGLRAPFVSVCFTIFLFGLAGIPPLAGFFGKFMLIGSAVSADLIGLSIFLVVFSCLSLYYYLSIVVEIWLKPESRHTVNVVAGGDFAHMPKIVGLLAAASVVVGVVGPRWAQLLDYTVAAERRVRGNAEAGEAKQPELSAGTADRKKPSELDPAHASLSVGSR
jgi:NADH-quinone oxidoreductase subunit N